MNRTTVSAAGEPHEVYVDVLGPLRVRREATFLHLGPPKRQVILIRLLLEDGNAVSADELCEDVWAGRPPASALSSLHAHISRLRAVLEPRRHPHGKAEVLVSEPHGYALRIPPQARDAVRFDTAVSRAQVLLREGQGRAARRHVEDSLAMWRGAAISEARDYPFAARAAAQLEEGLLAAQELHVSALIHDGALQQAVSAAETLTSRHPLREVGWGLLMSALYLAGRHAHALERYEKLRRYLAEELGLAPGPALGALQEAILRHDVALVNRLLQCDAKGMQTGLTARERSHGHGPVPDLGRHRGWSESDRGTGVDPAVSGVQDDQRFTDRYLNRPAQLPADLGYFTGRRAELAQADELLRTALHSSTPTVGVIGGAPGIGKSAFAVHWAHRVAHHFPDGQLFANLRGFDIGGAVLEPAEALHGFLTALGTPAHNIPDGADSRAALYRSMLAGRRMLVVIDNAWDEEQVRPLLPGMPGSVVLVTSRNQLPGLVAAEGARVLTLGVPPLEELHEGMALRLGAARVSAEPRAVTELIELCARLPLALAIVAARATLHPHFSLASVVEDMRSTEGSLDAFAGTDVATDVRAAFSWSYRALSTGAGRLFRLLALHPCGDLRIAAAASLAGLPLGDTRALMRELLRTRMVVENDAGRYSLHDLLRVYATELVYCEDSGAERVAALRRMFEHYVRSAAAASCHFTHSREPVLPAPAAEGVTTEHFPALLQAMLWFSAERQNLKTLVKHATDTGFDEHARQLLRSMREYLSTKEDHPQAFAKSWTAGGLARDGLDTVDLAETYSDGGQRPLASALARCRRSIALFRELGAPRREAFAWENLAHVHYQLGEHEQAIRCYEAALGLLCDVADTEATVSALTRLADAYRAAGDPDQAQEAWSRALKLARSGPRGDQIQTVMRRALPTRRTAAHGKLKG
ncbi:AfsR/SARP family transcriptional regulator [Streptomyces sp. NPDC098781]|uniref:AfsR/SARP family transcriptional regulator n=1 Tax=Streptomyces sp. NPDC098781 TaxID=3366097 RepID=UPI003824771C